jgi:cytochrome oxidase assembly protein ShyY1
VTSVPEKNEWRRIAVTGSFDTSRQILLRNHYTDEGEYGFELLTAFVSHDAGTFWVDCGWVKAPATASMKPTLPTLPTGEVTINGRLRLNRSLPEGAFFAVSKAGQSSLIRAANAQAGHDGITSPYYIDLLGGNFPQLTPEVPAQLPELSDGPHMAYAVQWIFFGSLALYGRFLIRRETMEELKQ